MTEMSGYPPGVPCWVDLSSTDVKMSAEFYREIFGWDAELDPRPEAGGYGQFTLRGKKVAGIGPAFEGMPSAWNTYVATVDAASTAQAVRSAGGAVVMEPMQVFEEGSLAVFQDPTGAFIGAWQAGKHTGAELVNEPGAFTWSELATRDVEAAKAFYAQVFGWRSQTNDMGGMQYTEFKVDERSVAGMMPIGDQFPPDVPPHWLVYLGVTDCDATVARIQELGGSVFVPPMDIPIGRFSVVADPQYAVFAVWQAAEE